MCVHQEERGLGNTPGPAVRTALSTATGRPLFTLMMKGRHRRTVTCWMGWSENDRNAYIDLEDEE
ncbi:hypothetical protein E2C01_026733 [Portunus trituberculatus]|uniref:Uncharacterized protein n=1 Tax=Portunus trituberculatus TaxID=210409 RepID=A0A5B7ELT4_PORTR|nr:hypothetical protein [Portunus trituberculatus]